MWSRLSHLNVLPGDFLFQGSGVRWVKLDTQTHGEWRLGYKQEIYFFQGFYSNQLWTSWKMNKPKTVSTNSSGISN